MLSRRPHISRVLSRAEATTTDRRRHTRADAPRKLHGLVIDFSTLHLPADVSNALAEAFWSQLRVRAELTALAYWYHLKVFARFVAETHAVARLRDIGSALLLRYIEWLNRQRGKDGKPWSKGTRHSTYTTLRIFQQWLQRCRPGALGEIEFPINPYPWKNRDVQRVSRFSAQELQAILKACEHDITALRNLRDEAEQEMAAARGRTESVATLGGLLLCIDRRYGGVVPLTRMLSGEQNHVLQALYEHGGIRRIEPYLYPRAESLFPYYLAILIHTAGNPEPITELDINCLQPIPLLDDRELLVWSKSRAGALQRRSFGTADSFEPPALVRELVQWTQRLRPHARAADRDRLFLYKGQVGVTALSMQMAKKLPECFAVRHHLPYRTLVSIRPSVLTVFYRVSGDLRQVKAIANHAHLSTTVGYVQGPEVETQNRRRVAALQSAFLGQLERSPSNDPSANEIIGIASSARCSAPASTLPPGAAVSMFGFTCKDPFAGVAPGTRRGELCTNFLGCFTCPNAVITADAPSLARLLQARDHLRAANSYLHPARWEAIYAPQLRILEEDILTRFSGRELAAAAPLRDSLPPLPQLR